MNGRRDKGRSRRVAGAGGDPAVAAGSSALARTVSYRSEDSCRILWYSNAPWTSTGYGQQTAQAVSRLTQQGHEVAVHAMYGLEGAPSTWNGIKIYPRGLSAYSDDIIVAHWMEWTHATKLPKLLMTLFDVWVLKAPNLDKIPNIASWVPIDHQPCPPAVAEWCQRPNVLPIAMSQFGQRMLEQLGIRSVYVPHGIEDVFKPTPSLSDANGKQVTGRQIMGIEDDKFVVMMTAANKGVVPSRKAFAENFMAFAMFAADHPDAVLYMHSEATGAMGGIDLNALATACGIKDEQIKWADPYIYRQGFPNKALAAMYSGADVLLASSMGEGFGIPVVEAQACGTRVIVSNFTAQPELVGDGWLVDGQPWWDAAQRSWFFTPSVPSILNALRGAYEAPRSRSEKAIAHARGYEADHVFEAFWKPAMKEIAEWCRTSQR